MIAAATISPARVLIPVGLGTSLSLIGDTALYTVLPTHTAEVGITLVSVGVILSANRWIRLLLNGPAGVFYDRSPRRSLFVPALFAGALSTALYATSYGFWPLFTGRLLWGVAWVGIWIGGNTIVLDIAGESHRGRWVGIYHMTFFVGAAVGALLGGILTDQFGYQAAMIIAACLTLFGAVVALLFLPETRNMQVASHLTHVARSREDRRAGLQHAVPPGRRAGFIAATALMAGSRLVIAGFLLSTLGLFLASSVGDSVEVRGVTLGVATLTGFFLSLNALVSMVAAPSFGALSDRLRNRWRAAAAGLLPGIAGFSLLAFAAPWPALLGVPLSAVTGGSNQSVSIALAEEAGKSSFRSRRLGILFTVGDLASAIGPLLAFALIPLLGVNSLYMLSALLLAALFVFTALQSRRAVTGGDGLYNG